MKTTQVFQSISLAMLLTACNGADFYGSQPGRAQQPPPPPAESISCEINPGSIKPTESAAINVAVDGYAGPLTQTILGSDEPLVQELAFSEGNYVRADGEANGFSADADGTYTIELRKDATSEAADATCQVVVKTEPVEPGMCTDTEFTIGAHVAFMIDNSNSNAATDCPNPSKIGRFKNADLYRCAAATNREKAVLAAFDELVSVAANETDNPDALSRFAISSFPTREEPNGYITGYMQESAGWINSIADERDAMRDSLEFTREPFGLTPYGAGIKAAEEVFTGVNDNRTKLAVLVTDGEPTDSDPTAVAAQAEALRAAGVKVYTVFVTNGEARSERRTRHTNMMRAINDTSLERGDGNWYNADEYGNFDEYVASLLGGAGQESLAARISDNRLIEVADSAALKQAFLDIIGTEIRCVER